MIEWGRMGLRCEWKKVKLGDITFVTKLAGFEYTKYFSNNFLNEGVPVIQGRNIKDRRLNLDNMKFISKDLSDSLVRSKINRGDILFSYVGTVGDVYLHDSNKQIHLGSNVAKICVLNKENVLVKFIYYFLQGADSISKISSKTKGSVQSNINMADLRSIEIDLPPLPEQKAIAETLSCLDDKIELNNKINANLEQTAQAIFKSWFVDFEPFQDGEFVESELGRIPKGWRVGNLLDIAQYLNGIAMQKFRPDDDEKGLPVLKIKELRQGLCDDSSELCTENIKPEYIVNDGDVIFSWSGSLLVDFWCGGPCGLNQHLFKVTSEDFDKWFYYVWTTYHLQKFIAIASGKATTMGHIKREDLTSSAVLIPDPESYGTIGNLLAPLYDQIISNRIENRKLAEIRDNILPKLMSGEIDVSEVTA